MEQNNKFLLKMVLTPGEWILRLVRSDFKWLGHILVSGLRFTWRHHPGPVERSPKETMAIPTGPYAVKRRQQMGDLLLWVPLHIESFIIDDLTGRYGYSHITIDTGEVDSPTGKSVMAEVTIGQAVKRKFLDEYGSRPYARVPLSKTGVDAETFVSAVVSRMGEPYSDLKALTMGEIDDPAKQVCSSLAADSLPERVRHEIAKARRLGLLHRNSVSVHSHMNAPETKVFISPNGFAQYYGAPRGEKVRRTNFLIEPHPVDTSVKSVVRKHGWKAALILAAIGVFISAALLFINHNWPKKI
jgi:hypothetical protein